MANMSSDVGTDELRRTGNLKAISGGDRIRGQKKGQNAFYFYPSAKIIMCCNQLPKTPDESHAFYRRFQIFEMKRKFEGSEAEVDIIERITTPCELSGLMNWALVGLHRLLDRGYFEQTKNVEEMKQYYKELASPELGFARNCLDEKVDGYVTKDQLYYAYRSYCRQKGFIAKQKNRIKAELETHVFLSDSQITIDGKRTHVWKGIELNAGCSDLCTDCTGCTGTSYSSVKGEEKSGYNESVQGVQPVQLKLRSNLQESLDKLYELVVELHEATEFILISEHGYKEDSLNRLLSHLEKDGLIFMPKQGVWVPN